MKAAMLRSDLATAQAQVELWQARIADTQRLLEYRREELSRAVDLRNALERTLKALEEQGE